MGAGRGGSDKDQLNEALKPYGYFFAPELSTSNRATLGGMINTDASGQVRWSMENVRSRLRHTGRIVGGDILDTQSMPVELARRWVKTRRHQPHLSDRLSVLLENRQLILDSFPKLNRFLTGYDLRHVFNDDMTRFDLTRILTGSEGRWRLLLKLGWILPRYPKSAVW